MGKDVFISHSSGDRTIAEAACAALEADGVLCWIAPRDIPAGTNWASSILKGINECRMMVLVFSAAANESEYVRREVGLAVDRGIPIAPFRVQAVKPTGELKFHLHSTHWMDALSSPEQHLGQLVASVRTLLEAAGPPPSGGPSGPGSAREGPSPAPAAPRAVNDPPAECPAHFQRRAGDELVGRWIEDPACRLILLSGRAGIGKTTLACRLLKRLEGVAPGGAAAIQGTVYLGPQSGALSFANLFAGLCQFVGEDARRRLEALYADPKPGADAKTRALLKELRGSRVVVLLDNFEDALDPASFTVADPELGEALRALLETGRHGVTALLTSRFTPRDLVRAQPGRQKFLEIDQGLGPAEAAAMLRDMDPGGQLGLRDATPELLEEARRRTDGNPRALELIKGILAADLSADLRDLLAADLPPDLTEVLIGEAFRRLGPLERAASQAVAVYLTPLGPAATPESVNFLLQPFFAGAGGAAVPGAAVLSRLVHLRLASRSRASGVYSMRDGDAAYVLSRIDGGTSADGGGAGAATAGGPPFTRPALFRRAADWFRGRRVPPDRRRAPDDLVAHLTEFELRSAAGDYDAASDVLAEIDFDHLIKGGSHRPVIDRRERLEGRLCRPSARRYNASILGICHAALGQLDDAVGFHERALAIARETGPPEAEAAELVNLGYCRFDLGQTRAAMRLFEESLALARARGDRYREGVALSNMGCCHVNLGDLVAAEAHHRPAVEIARELREPRDEANRLCNLARCRLDEGRFAEAAGLSAAAVAAAAQCDDPAVRVEAQRAVAWSRFASGELTEARAAADAACTQDVHGVDYRATLVLGVVALRQGDAVAAAGAFGVTVERAGLYLSRCDRLFSARDGRALALCGLALCERGQAPARTAEAVAAFRAARAVNSDPGVVARVLYQLDAMVAGSEITPVLLAQARVAAVSIGPPAESS